MQNPFTSTYGIKPELYIQSDSMDDLLENFSHDDPTEKAYMITGVRGSGKTVLLADLSERMKGMSFWEVININPVGNMLDSLASKLYDIGFIHSYLADAKIDISFMGIGVSVKSGRDKVFNIETAIEKMLDGARKEGKKILITIDEASPSEEMEAFCLEYQALIRERYPVFLIMTGLHQNIDSLSNMKKCTFLTRTPRIRLSSLDESSIAVIYKKILNVTKENSIKMAELTKGYAYAFQTLGRICFEMISKDQDPFEDEIMEDLLFQYESELIRYSYRKIWSELSEKDIEVIKAMVKLNGDGPVKREELMKETGFSSSMMNRYRQRLMDKGLITTSKEEYGSYSFALPMFSSFVRDYYMD